MDPNWAKFQRKCGFSTYYKKKEDTNTIETNNFIVDFDRLRSNLI